MSVRLLTVNAFRNLNIVACTPGIELIRNPWTRMTDRAWESDDNYLGPGVLRDSAEGRRICEEHRQQHLLREQQDEALHEYPQKRLELLIANMTRIAREKDLHEIRIAELEIEMVFIRRSIINTKTEISALTK